jgi:hypothetical protein
MIWVDYNIESLDNGVWRVEKEAVDKGLYSEGDIFVVRNGWLVKLDPLTVMIVKHESKNNEM